MRYKREITEGIVYLIVVILILFWHEEKIFSFLIDEGFLDILAQSAITLSGLGITLLGIIIVLPEREDQDVIRARRSRRVRRTFISILKRTTAYFLLGSSFAFLCYAIPENAKLILVMCSALSTILFSSGLLRLLYVCLKIEEASSNVQKKTSA